MKNVPIKGIIPPIVTPMNADESVNIPELRSQIERQIAGGVQICALYACETDEIARAVDAYLPFTLRLDHPAAGEDTQALLDCRICAADARLVNSRKILFRAEVGAQILGYSSASADIPLLKETPRELQLRCRTYPLRLPVETAEKSFLLSEELPLPAGQIAAEKIAAVSVLPEITEQRLAGSKAVFKGTLQVRILYFAADRSLNTFSQSLPFSQYCPLQADYDEDAMQLLPLVTGCDAQLLTPSGASGFLLSVNLLAQCLDLCVLFPEQAFLLFDFLCVYDNTLCRDFCFLKLAFFVIGAIAIVHPLDELKKSLQGSEGIAGLYTTLRVDGQITKFDDEGQLAPSIIVHGKAECWLMNQCLQVIFVRHLHGVVCGVDPLHRQLQRFPAANSAHGRRGNIHLFRFDRCRSKQNIFLFLL